MPDWGEVLRQWMGAEGYELLLILVSVIGIYFAVILYTRIFGLRSFSKMSSFDFASTVAVGSVMASTITSARPSLAHGATALLCLYLVQWTTAKVRLHLPGATKAIDNTPVVLMVGREMRHDAMRAAEISEGDVYAKLREANVLNLDQVRCVILETTGDISVMHGDPSGPPISGELLQGIEGAETVTRSPEGVAAG